MRRVGKIGRRKVFPKVKNVNVESLKKRSKLLDFWSAGVTRRREGETKRGRVKESKRGRDGGTRRVTSYCHFLFYVRCVRHVRYVRYKRYVRFAPISPFAPFAPFAPFVPFVPIAPIAHSRDSCSKFHLPVRLLSQNVGLLCPVCVWLRDFL